MQVIQTLSPAEALDVLYTWRLWARPEQLAPLTDWDTWMIQAGRGFGKTRSGAEWVHEQIKAGCGRVALIARTAADCRDTIVDGESGILATAHPGHRPRYEASKARVTWPNGATAKMFSAEEPDSLRGPQFEKAWADELAAWKYPQEAHDQLRMVLRLGKRPQLLVTTTPRPIPLIKALIADPGTIVTRGSTFDNKANLAKAFIRQIIRQYEGTRLGRQELHAEVLDDNPGALWKRIWLDQHRVRSHPTLVRVVVAVDPAVTSNADSAETGIVVCGLGDDGHGYVLADYSLVGTPAEWGAAAVTAYNVHHADCIVGEVNNGGDLVEANIRVAGPSVNYKGVRASRGKATRAEPIAALYEQGRVHHLGALAQLEDQQCDWDPTSGAASPDRIDADVWGLTELMLGDVSNDYDSLTVVRTSHR